MLIKGFFSAFLFCLYIFDISVSFFYYYYCPYYYFYFIKISSTTTSTLKKAAVIMGNITEVVSTLSTDEVSSEANLISVMMKVNVTSCEPIMRSLKYLLEKFSLSGYYISDQMDSNNNNIPIPGILHLAISPPRG